MWPHLTIYLHCGYIALSCWGNSRNVPPPAGATANRIYISSVAISPMPLQWGPIARSCRGNISFYGRYPGGRVSLEWSAKYNIRRRCRNCVSSIWPGAILQTWPLMVSPHLGWASVSELTVFALLGPGQTRPQHSSSIHSEQLPSFPSNLRILVLSRPERFIIHSLQSFTQTVLFQHKFHVAPSRRVGLNKAKSQKQWIFMVG